MAAIDQTPVTQETADLINKLNDHLKAELGNDFSYVIMGKGYPIAASNLKNGFIPPKIKPPIVLAIPTK